MSMGEKIAKLGISLFLKGKLPKWVYRLIGRKVAKQLELKEDSMPDGVPTVKWYKSKGVITGIVTVVIALYMSVDSILGPQLGFNLPDIPEWLFALLGGLGIYSRVNSTGTVTK